MSTATAAARRAPTNCFPSDYRFSVDQYHRMIDAGVLTESDRVELLEGRLVIKMTKKPPHDLAVDLTQTAIAALLPAAWRVRVQSAISTPDSEPEPDVAVVLNPPRRYATSHPRPHEIALLVEVADTSLLQDQTDKKRLYARAGIPVYWIVNLIDRRVEVYTGPKGGRSPTYRQVREYRPRQNVPLMIAGQEVGTIAVSDLLP